jgi:hypothetical protein
MMFNGFATAGSTARDLMIIGIMAILVIGGWIFRQFARERAAIGWRLDDYVRAGWLNERDPQVFMLLKCRVKLLSASFLRGWKTWRATANFMNDIIELAYLRGYMTTGLVDAAGIQREHELLVDIAARRALALTDVAELKVWPPNWTFANASAHILRMLPWRKNGNKPTPAAPVGYRQSQYSHNLVAASRSVTQPTAVPHQEQQGQQITTWQPPHLPTSRMR